MTNKKILDLSKDGQSVKIYETRDYDIKDTYNKKEFGSFIDKLVVIHNNIQHIK